jgi:tetratricopeptide (TPR) repeat protein
MLCLSPASRLPQCLTFLILLLSTAEVAHAAPASGTPAVAEAEAFATRAKELFKARDFQRSAKMFMQAYALSHEPALVYNAARAYEEAGMAGDAASLFRLYISLTDDADGILEARERIKRLEGKTPTAASGPATALPSEPTQVTGSADASAQPGWPRWAATGGAGLTLTAGVVLLFVGKAGTDDANARLTNDRKAYNDAFDTAQTQWWSGAGLTGLGVGLSGLATWLWLRDGSSAVVVIPATDGLRVAYQF